MLFNILKKDDRIKGTVNQSFIYHYDSMDFEVSGFLQMEFDSKKLCLRIMSLVSNVQIFNWRAPYKINSKRYCNRT